VLGSVWNVACCVMASLLADNRHKKCKYVLLYAVRVNGYIRGWVQMVNRLGLLCKVKRTFQYV